MNPVTTKRFPLIARSRPACTPLPQRITALQERATSAQSSGNTSAAVAVFNLSALLASDCGLPDLARAWCHRLAHATLDNDRDPQHGLEAVVNLARLHIRAGKGKAAWTLLETLFQAIDTRTDSVIDGLTIPASRIADTPNTHARLRAWLWRILLGTGAHALAVAGRWDDATHRLTAYNGVGNRMLDGRQIAVLAHVVAGRHHQAHAMLEATHPGDEWENAVTACLSLLVARDPEIGLTTLRSYLDRGSAHDGLFVFHTRLGLTTLDALGPDHPSATDIAASLISNAAHDGYAARDVLAHPVCLGHATHQQTRQLTALVKACGLDTAAIPKSQLSQLDGALRTAESVITQPGVGVSS